MNLASLSLVEFEFGRVFFGVVHMGSVKFGLIGFSQIKLDSAWDIFHLFDPIAIIISKFLWTI